MFTDQLFRNTSGGIRLYESQLSERVQKAG